MTTRTPTLVPDAVATPIIQRLCLPRQDGVASFVITMSLLTTGCFKKHKLQILLFQSLDNKVVGLVMIYDARVICSYVAPDPKIITEDLRALKSSFFNGNNFKMEVFQNEYFIFR
ncbi:hypothetical protein AVEN_107741-1 [Araneus ventricosus]|uniref:Uncharacterized protein n=1 Tax=Araneus ventricosus TaxID=182803 RepID=A0A4Y2J0N8_ARAVE|nr:hypothetical protein AVEN_107741-1 [Araneus ventricosus]